MRAIVWSIGSMLVVSGSLAGCGGLAGGSLNGLPSADFGATQGGVQDMQLARELIAAGNVPPAEALLVEAMFSEHDLPLGGAATDRLLCLRSAVGWAPDGTGTPAAWVQVGMSSTIDPAAYVRPAMSIVAVVDVSSSMGWEYAKQEGTYQSGGALTRGLLRIVEHLTEADQFAMVTFSDGPAKVLDFISGDRHSEIDAAVEALRDEGCTNMEGGVRMAYELAAQATGGRPKRLLLFTDAQPNVGASTPTEMDRLMQNGAAQGIGLTVFAAGVGISAEVLQAITHPRGGNAFTLFGTEDADRIMANDWPFLMDPIAYDLTVDIDPGSTFTVAESYGFPSAGVGEEPQAKMTASSVFLSKRRGALLVRLAGVSETATLADLNASRQLSYETPDGQVVTQDLAIAPGPQPLDERGHYYEQPSVGKTIALALLVAGMHSAAELYANDQGAAVERMQAVVARFEADSQTLGDSALAPELALAQRMLALMQEGAPQGDLYGQV